MTRTTLLLLLLLSGCQGAQVRAPQAEAVERSASTQSHFDAAVAQAGGRVILSRASLRIEVDDVEQAVQQACELARQAKGFVLGGSKSSVTVRVPAAGFLELLAQYERMGEVTRKSLWGRDVTESYVDLQARLKSAEKFRLRYEELLKKARDVQETLAVEKELERVQQQIESLTGKVKLIQDQAALSRIDVSFEEALHPGPLLWVGKGLYWALSKLFVW